MEKIGSTSEKEEWRRLEGKNPTKWHWEKGSWRWGIDKIEALQNGSGIFICYIKSLMHAFDHFLTKLSKYLWIKTGDRHYHFVEPWVIDRPFCRMETVYQNHFVETGVGSLQNGAPQPPPGNGKEDLYSRLLKNPNLFIANNLCNPITNLLVGEGMNESVID